MNQKTPKLMGCCLFINKNPRFSLQIEILPLTDLEEYNFHMKGSPRGHQSVHFRRINDSKAE